MFKAIFSLSIAMFFSGSVMARVPAHPDAKSTPQMSCAVGVYKAKDFLDIEDRDPKEFFEIVTLPLPGANAIAMNFKIRGETVGIFLDKYEFTNDVYRISLMLLTPTAQLPPRGPSYHASVHDDLLIAGPAKGSWDIKPGPNATRFDYMRYQGRAVGLSLKTVKVLKSAGVWGKHPYTGSVIAAMGAELTDFVKEQLAAGNFQDDDVIGIAALLNCTREP